MKKTILTSFMMVLIFTVVCGGIYTLAMTGIGQIAFSQKSNGSIIEVDGKKYGSELLGQQFTDEKHMWGRIMNIDTKIFKDENNKELMYATPSNISPASEEYEKLVNKRVDMIRKSHPQNGDMAIPVDLVTCSGSGLDPHISLEASNYQLERIAKNNDMSLTQVQQIVDKCTTKKFLGIFGENTVNVLKVNLMLENILK